MVYAGEDYATPIRLVGNHSFVLQPFAQRSSTPQQVEHDLPAATAANGALLLELWPVLRVSVPAAGAATSPGVSLYSVDTP